MVRTDQLLDIACENHGATTLPFFRCWRFPVEIVREKFFRAHDGPGDQLREECNEERVVDVAANRGLFFTIDVDYVRHALKGVEADAEREDDCERFEVKDFAREVGVFEIAEETEVRAQAYDERGAAWRALAAFDPSGGQIVDGDE